MSSLWLKEGLHYGLHVEHHRGGDAGAFTGGGRKMIWHITVSRWGQVDGMRDVLIAKHAEPHIVIGGRPGTKLPVAIQMVPFNLAGRSLAHPSGPETNRANCIQVEICATPGSLLARLAEDGQEAEGLERFFALPDFDLELAGMTVDDAELCMDEDHPSARYFASGVASWTDDTYKALANLTRLVNDTRGDGRKIPWRIIGSFARPRRFGGQEFYDASGHGGHNMVPQNSHWDPTPDFKGSHLMDLLHRMPDGGFKL